MWKGLSAPANGRTKAGKIATAPKWWRMKCKCSTAVAAIIMAASLGATIMPRVLRRHRKPQVGGSFDPMDDDIPF